jgi:predicted nucleic acid-binding protein
MIFVFDTNILVHYIRQSDVFQQIQTRFSPFAPDNQPVISVVTLGEIRSFAGQNDWGEKRLAKLEALLREFYVVDILPGEIIDRYVEIDLFSQAKHPLQIANFTARNMGKTTFGLQPQHLCSVPNYSLPMPILSTSQAFFLICSK